MQKLIYLLLPLFVLSCNGREATGVAPEPAGTDQPNIVFILADDLGYGDVGYNGQKRIRTPRIDSLAKQGIILTSHYSGSTVCAPSRASLMTGLHQGHAPVRGNRDNVLREGTLTLGKVLQSAGYRTAMIGKWGLGEQGTSGEPSKMGFDHYYGYLNQIHAHNYYPDHLVRNGQREELDNEIIIQTKGYAAGIGQASTNKKAYSHHLLVGEAMDFIQASQDKPFFLYLPLTIPHVNNEAKIVGTHGMEVPDYGRYADEKWPEVEKGKAAMISLMDRDVGRLQDLIDSLGLTEKTLFIFSSDNGPHDQEVDPEFFDSNGPLRGIKRDLYEGGIRVPFVAVWPGKIRPGTRSDLPTAFWDYVPTLGAAAGAKTAEVAVDGLSFLPTLLGKPAEQAGHEYLYWEFSESVHKAQAVRSGNWKLVHPFATGAYELYNLSTDLGETKNLADRHPEILARLKGYLADAHVKNDTYPLPFEKELR
jgi:arylsulfatase A-like enzyme